MPSHEAHPDLESQFEAMRDSMRQTRVAYGFPPEPPNPLTLEEMQEVERRNAATAVVAAQDEFGGTRAGQDPMSFWYARPTHKRDLPAYAHFTIAGLCWTDDAAASLALRAWSMPEWPGQYPSRDWRAMFDSLSTRPLCSETVEDAEAECSIPHDQTLTVYRAAFSSEKRGLAWTLDRKTAVWFANRGDMAAGGPGKGRQMRVWRTVVSPNRVYAHITSRHESEVVCDVRGLRIVEEPVRHP